MGKFRFSILISGVCLSATIAIAAGDEATTEGPPTKIITKCQSCHGLGGDSVSVTVPRLNGQEAAYIVGRLNNFLDPTHEDPHAMKSMWGVVSEIDNSSFASLAAYYSRQMPTQSEGHGAQAQIGRKIYMDGARAEQVPACETCHGPHAEGSGAVPRLAGQHAVYLKNQLERLSFALRESDTMHPNLYRITDDQINALVAYLANN
jgi:cytochrome c553